jgi:hypothetical protein
VKIAAALDGGGDGAQPQISHEPTQLKLQFNATAQFGAAYGKCDHPARSRQGRAIDLSIHER